MNKSSLAIVLLLLFAGCRTVEPPRRPVAYLFPSVRTMAEVQGMQRYGISLGELTAVLDQIGCGPLLRQAGLLDGELATIVRGLAHRGYSELDARRSPGTIQWLSFGGLPGGELEIVAGFRELPPKGCRAGLDPQRASVVATEVRQDAYGRRQVVSSWSADAAQLRELRWPDGGPAVYWEMRWLIRR